jgi:two-component system, NtrC family, sensor kinase
VSVLIVDDSLTVRMNLLELLNGADLPTRACETIAEARIALGSESFSVVILDVLLPDGDGVEFLQEIRAMPKASGTAIVLLSTEHEVRHRVRGLMGGADEYIGKPYDPGYLVARARELARRNETVSSGQETVLLIDDSDTFREALKAALEGASYRVIPAASGEEGLRLAAGLRPTAFIVDGQLPGIDGATFIRRIRLDAALRALPCLLLTASEDRSAELAALDAGADAFARKEGDTAVILARFTAMLRGAQGRSERVSTASLQGPKRILAVDDSETYLHQVADALRAEGYELVLARSGEEALELLSVQPVDCVLLDLMMPGIGGRETCQRVKNTPSMRDIPIVLLTAVEDRQTMIQGLGAGADDYIAKSSDFDVLRARVLAQIRRKQFEDENRTIREQLLRTEFESMEARTAREVAEARAALVEELQAKNEELDSFSYSVAHDLRAPLRSLDGFSLALLEDYGDKLDESGREYLKFIRESAQQMATLIDDLLALSRVTRSEFRREAVDLTEIARQIGARLQETDPDRRVEFVVADDLCVRGDNNLLALVLENLIGNAWKYSSKRPVARIEVGSVKRKGQPAFFVRDNGAGFDMAYASKLFGVFQRLHSAREFEGTGIGLATVQRIVRRHGGRIWGEGKVDGGATFYFTLANGQGSSVMEHAYA